MANLQMSEGKPQWGDNEHRRGPYCLLCQSVSQGSSKQPQPQGYELGVEQR